MSELIDTAAAVAARALPHEAVEAYVSRSHDTHVRAYGGSVEQLTSAGSEGIGIRVVLGAEGRSSSPTSGGEDAHDGRGNRVGFAWAGSLEPSIVEGVLADARDNARFATPDPDLVLAAPDGAERAELDLWRPALGAVPVDRKVEVALELEKIARGADVRVRTVRAADYADSMVEVAVASSAGISATSRRTVAHLSVAVIAGSGAESQTGTGLSAGRSLDDLDSEEAATDAVKRAVRLLGAGKAATARRTVVFDPRVTSTILSIVGAALSGEAEVRGRTFFAGRRGEKVGTSDVTLVDDPTDSRSLRASPHDGEGLACRRNVLLDKGVLSGFVYDTVSGRRAGSASTGSAARAGFAGTPHPACRSLVLAPGCLDQAEILAAVGDGLYVQSVTGVHSGVNPVSGDFSVGADGLVIRTGSLAEPVRELTVASTLQRMLLSVLYVGADVRWLPGVAAGQTLAFADMQVSGR